jgi:hypothetical protein
MFMLLFVGCNNDHTAPPDDQWRKYAEVKYGKYDKDGVYIAKGAYVTKGKYIEYAEDVVYVVTKGKYGKYAKEDTSIEEGHNKPLAKEGNGKPLAKDGNWLGTTMSPLPQGQLDAYVMRDDDEPLTTRASDCLRHARQRQAALGPRMPCKATTSPSPQYMTFNNCEGTKALTIKLIKPIVSAYHCNEAL